MNNQTPKSRMHCGLKTMASLCRGNTLVPIIIALSISSVAAVAFLKQGADLSEKQKQINAPDEVLDIIEEFVQVNSTKDYANIVASDLTFPGKKNVYGQEISYTETVMNYGVRTAAFYSYPAKTVNNCNHLETIIKKYKLMVKISCSHWYHSSCDLSDLCIVFRHE